MTLTIKHFYYHEDEHCAACGYQEIILQEECRVCIFCGTIADGPLPINELVIKCVEKLGEEKPSKELLVSIPTIKRWAEGKNLPKPNVEDSLRKGLAKLLCEK